MTNRDLIERMEQDGHYGEAEELRRSLDRQGESERSRVDRSNPADGFQHTYAGDCAERAYRDLQSEQRRLEERREEEEMQRAEWEQRQREHWEQSQQEELC